MDPEFMSQFVQTLLYELKNSLGQSQEVIYGLLVIVFIILPLAGFFCMIFMRGFWCWYLKVNERINIMKNIERRLEIMQETVSRAITQNNRNIQPPQS